MMLVIMIVQAAAAFAVSTQFTPLIDNFYSRFSSGLPFVDIIQTF